MLIIALAVVFFALLFVKYTSLRPSQDIQGRLPVCSEDFNGTFCVNESDVDDIIDLFKDVFNVLEAQSVEFLCNGKNQNLLNSNNEENATDDAEVLPLPIVSLEDLLSLLDTNLEENRVKELMPKFFQLLAEYPKFGIDLLDKESRDASKDVDAVAYLALSRPTINWSCWFFNKLVSIYAFLCVISVYLVYAGLFCLLNYGAYRLYVWRKERQLQDQQEVFELVEQVLSLLVSQHQVRQILSYLTVLLL